MIRLPKAQNRMHLNLPPRARRSVRHGGSAQSRSWRICGALMIPAPRLACPRRRLRASDGLGERRAFVQADAVLCRLHRWTEAVERKFPGTYNESSRKELSGYQHGNMIAHMLYENGKTRPNGKNWVLAFTPETAEPMLVACPWNRSPAYKGAPNLYSFAGVTDEPQLEV